MNKTYAPICLFTFNRIGVLKKTVEALKANYLASKSILYIFSDGPRSNEEFTKVMEVRDFLKSINGFEKIIIKESRNNMGLAHSIISGVSNVIKKHEKVIVLEDDLVTTSNFLDFMNQALDFYIADDSVFSISGYSLNLKSLKNHKKDFYFGKRASSWGWATWKKDWLSVDWEVKMFTNFKKSKQLKRAFNNGGSDMTSMLNAQMKGKIDSWAIRFCFQQFLNQQACVFPTISKVQSLGFSKEATHTTGSTKFITILDKSQRRKFIFEKFNEYDFIILKDFKRKFSFTQRVLDRIIKIFYV